MLYKCLVNMGIEDQFHEQGQEVLDLIPAAVIKIDASGSILYANKGAEALLGYSGDDLVQNYSIQNISYFPNEFHSLNDVQTLFGSASLAAAKDKDGQPVPVSVSVNASGGGAVVCLQKVDDLRRYCQSIESQLDEYKNHVSDLHFTHEALEKQGEELARLSEEIGFARDDANMANIAKSEFLATMSHELRTPLNGILGMASVIMEQAQESSLQSNIQTIFESGEILLELLNDILDLSKIEAGHLDLEIIGLDLQYLVDQMANLWRPKIGSRGIDFIVEMGTDVPRYINSDPVRIRQLLTNLVNNAVKFTHEGSITVAVHTSRIGSDAGHLKFSVTDTGIGIPQEKLATLFEKFTQADSSTTRQYGGTGLGLAICEQLTELMGGSINVTSVLDKGSCFTFEIPYMLANENSVVKSHQLHADDVVATYLPMNVLIAEDNPVNQVVITKMLEQKVASLTLCDNGKHLIDQLNKDQFDVILMDIQMPEMDGLEATHFIRTSGADYADIPIIALTANAMAGDREQYLKCGMNGYASKPVKIRDLMSELKRFCYDEEHIRYDRGLDQEKTVDNKPSAAAQPNEIAMDSKETAMADLLADL